MGFPIGFKMENGELSASMMEQNNCDIRGPKDRGPNSKSKMDKNGKVNKSGKMQQKTPQHKTSTPRAPPGLQLIKAQPKAGGKGRGLGGKSKGPGKGKGKGKQMITWGASKSGWSEWSFGGKKSGGKGKGKGKKGKGWKGK